jgi:hypothetical protein
MSRFEGESARELVQRDLFLKADHQLDDRRRLHRMI